MNLSNLRGIIVLLGITASALEWIFIENMLMAILSVIVTVVVTSFLYLKLSYALHNISINTLEFVRELLGVIIVMLIFISPIICFGRIILFKKEIGNPEINSYRIYTDISSFSNINE